MPSIIGQLPRTARGFTFNGFHSGVLDTWLLKSPISILPVPKDAFLENPGGDGVIDTVVKPDKRIIPLSCALNADSEIQLRERARTLGDWLNPFGGVKPLILDAEPNKYYLGRLNEALNIEDIIASRGMFNLAFVCPDPYAYAVADDTLTLTDGVSTVPYAFIRQGTANSYPIVKLYGTCDENGTIGYSVGGAQMRYSGDLLATDYLTFDHQAMTLTITNQAGITTNVLMYLQDFSFPVLTPGANTIGAVETGTGAWSKIEIVARSRWY